jgi:hypothetical protein
MSRPSKYRTEFAKQLLEYFGRPPYEQVIKKITEKSDDGTTRIVEIPQHHDDGRPVLHPSDIPTFAGFAILIGVHVDTLIEWTKNFAEFSEAYKQSKAHQENWLAVNLNRNLIPPAAGIFTAKNVIGWRDKQPDEVDVVINNHALSDEQLDNRIDALMKKSKKKGS